MLCTSSSERASSGHADDDQARVFLASTLEDHVARPSDEETSLVLDGRLSEGLAPLGLEQPSVLPAELIGVDLDSSELHSQSVEMA